MLGKRLGADPARVRKFGFRIADRTITGLLAMNIFLSGAAFAAMTPYRAIVGVETLGLSNAAFGLVMALNALGGSIIAVLRGWTSDKVEDRRVPVLLCAVGGVPEWPSLPLPEKLR